MQNQNKFLCRIEILNDHILSFFAMVIFHSPLIGILKIHSISRIIQPFLISSSPPQKHTQNLYVWAPFNYQKDAYK